MVWKKCMMYKKECTSYERKDNKGEENCKLIRIGGNLYEVIHEWIPV